MGNVAEDQAIHHPNRLTHGDNYFHKERDLQLNFEAIYNGWRIQGIGHVRLRVSQQAKEKGQ
jgi:hypothetical protein